MAVETPLRRLQAKAIPLLVRLQLSIGVVVQSLILLQEWYPPRGVAASGALALISLWLEKSVKV